MEAQFEEAIDGTSKIMQALFVIQSQPINVDKVIAFDGMALPRSC